MKQILIEEKSNLFQFEKFISKRFKYKASKNYKKLFNWSVENLNYFWSSLWIFTKVKEKN